jgi:uncharacterized membrane protein (UPF0136 family)
VKEQIPNADVEQVGGDASIPSKPQRDWPYWIAGLILGGFTGFLQVRVKDPTLSGVVLVAINLFLAFRRPRRPWRWGLLTALCLPTAELVAYLTREQPTRAMVWGSFVGLAPALAAAFGGSVIRRAITTLFPKK